MLQLSQDIETVAPRVALDPARLKVGPEGVVGFFWPVSLSQLAGFRDHLLAALNAQVKSMQQHSEDEADLLQIALPGFLYRCMALFEATLVVDTAWQRDLVLEAPADSFNLGPILAGEEPAEHPSDPRRRLRQVFPPEPAWRDAARFLWNMVRDRDIPIRGLGQVDRRRDVVCASIQGAIPEHAASVPDRVVYCHPRGWFPNRSAVPPSVPAPPLSAGQVEAAVSAFAAAATAFGATVPAPLLDYARAYLADLTGVVRMHLERLARQPRYLPERLWLVTAINPWCRTLVCATRRAGGRAIGHEHGTGESWSKVCGDTAFELDMLDSFVTFTEGSARHMSRQSDGLTLPRAAPCTIETLARRPRAPRLELAAQAHGTANRRVLVVSTFYRGDQMRFKPLPADIVNIDWQARLLCKLADWGCQVQFRPHPEDCSGIHNIYADRFGVPSIGGSLADAMAQSDLLIFDHPMSSAFVEALRTDLPIVLIDFGHSPFWDEAEAQLSRRVVLVKASYDTENRAAVDWNDLRAALDGAADLTNRDFYHAYFGDLA